MVLLLMDLRAVLTCLRKMTIAKLNHIPNLQRQSVGTQTQESLLQVGIDAMIKDLLQESNVELE